MPEETRTWPDRVTILVSEETGQMSVFRNIPSATVALQNFWNKPPEGFYDYIDTERISGTAQTYVHLIREDEETGGTVDKRTWIAHSAWTDQLNG